jgi:hypothetical protein
MDRGFINSKSIGTDPWDHMDPDPQPWIKAHKVFLGLASEVFLTLFSEKYTEMTVCMGPNRDLCRRTVRQKCRKVNNCFVDYGPWVEYLKNSNMPQSKPNYCSPLADFFNK